VTTIFPFGEILNSLVKGRGKVTVILPPGASPHTYELKPSELRYIENSLALFYGSSNLDNWVEKINHNNKIELINLIPSSHLLKIPLLIHNHGSKDVGIDPHFWTDPLTVKALLPSLCDTLCTVDPDGKEIYNRNLIVFDRQLTELHKKIYKDIHSIKNKSVFLSHPFFLYYLNRYEFVLAGIIEIQPGTEPTPKELKNYIDIAKNKQVKAVLTHTQLSDKPAQLVVEATQMKIIQLDPLGGYKNRNTYSDILMYNTNLLVKGLK
jgi:zinc transport system substrate-binding protein